MPKTRPAKKKTTRRGARKAPRSAFRASPKPNRLKAITNAATRNATATRGDVVLGEVTAPSGKLAVFDVGLIGYLPRPALEPALVIAEVPAQQTLPVIGRRVGKGRFADCWDHVVVQVGDGEVASSTKLGEAGVDFARLVWMDLGTLDRWQHEDSLDGLADFVFWGRDAGELASAMGAPRRKDGFGWRNLTIVEAESRAMDAERRKAAEHWLLATDLRPHSHHFYALAAARKSKVGAGTIEVGGAKVCLFFTSWGDGVFPIYLDLDHDDRPIQIRVQLHSADAISAMYSVNRLDGNA